MSSMLTLLICWLTLYSPFWGAVCERNERELFLRPQVFEENNVRHTIRKLSNIIQVVCYKNEFSVTFNKVQMSRLGILPNQLSLDRGVCQFATNQTNYQVRVQYGGNNICNSELKELEDRVIISNLVRIIPPSLLKYKSTDDEEESLMYGSGDGVESLPTSLQIIDIPFECIYPRHSVVTTTSEPPTDTPLKSSTEHSYGVLPQRPKPPKYRSFTVSSDFSIKLYKTAGFMHPYQPAASSITASTLLYAQIKPSNHLFEKAFLHNCYYNSAFSEKSDSHHNIYLIKNGCPIDESVMFLQELQGNERLFRFAVRRAFTGFTNIRCDLRPCTLHSAYSDTPACMSQMAYCTSKQLTTRDDEILTIEWPHNMVVVNSTEEHQQQGLEEEKQRIACPVRYREAPCNCEGEVTKRGLSDSSDDSLSVPVGWAIASAISCFVGGVILMSILWYISWRTSCLAPQDLNNESNTDSNITGVSELSNDNSRTYHQTAKYKLKSQNMMHQSEPEYLS